MSFLCQNGAYSSNRRRLRQRYLAGTLAGTTALTVVLSFGMPHAQEVEELPDSGRQVILDVSQSFEWSDNPDLLAEDEDRFTSRTGLQLSYGRRTGTDQFLFSLGGDIELRDDGDNGIDRPSAGLSWGRETARASTGIAFGVNEVDLGTTTGTFFDEITDSIDFGTLDRGTRRTADLSLFGTFGVDAPMGGSYEVSQRQIRYSNTDDPTLQDADRLTLDGELFFVLDPRIILGFDARQVDFDEEDEGAGERDTLNTRFGTYLETEINPRLTGRFDLGWQEVEETGTADNTEDGLVFGVALTRDQPRSSVTLSADSEITRNGRRDEVRVGQRIEFPASEMDYSVGLTRTEGFDTEPVFGVAWTQELPRAALRVSLDQRAATGRDDENLINSRFSVDYQRQLTTRSSFDVAFSFIDRDEQAAAGTDRQRYNLGLTYRYELTRDWDLAGGVSLVRQQEDGDEDIDANTVFIGLERQFVWN